MSVFGVSGLVDCSLALSWLGEPSSSSCSFADVSRRPVDSNRVFPPPPFLQPKVVLAKLLRTSISLRTHGPNSSLSFHSTPSRSSRSSHLRIIITTTTGHQLLYSLLPATLIGSSAARRSSTATAYVLPGGEKANANWPRGPGEGRELEGIILREEGVLSLKGLLNGSMNNWEEEEGTWKHS